MKINKILISGIILGILFVLTPSRNLVSAANGSAITIGVPGCPKIDNSRSNGSYSYIYYSSIDKDCVTITYNFQSHSLSRSHSPAINTDKELLSGLKTIYVPTFLSVDQINSFSVWSWLSMIVTFTFTLLVILWILQIVRGGIQYMHSLGDAGETEKAQKKITSVLVGIVFLFGFFLIINIVTGFLGIGDFTQWPRVLSQCGDGRYYYQVKLQNPDYSDGEIAGACFGL